ncbi:hypothetical protein AVEN_1328-1 [Araneus ventricosus]|uniref:Uncharacterized protein n=1 Tax=Araneus ventricosus TaxID=182803 RepID=A0A4Y2D2S3_ARAVE|nr:hypothetical protein AVEN_1328-1 [Araneus ventricosus]
MMWPDIINHENGFIPNFCSVRDHSKAEDLIPMLLSLSVSFLVMYRSMRSSIYTPTQTITPLPPNRTLSYTYAGLFRVSRSLQMIIRLLSVCTLKRDSSMKITLLHSARLHLRCSCANLLREALWSALNETQTIGL